MMVSRVRVMQEGGSGGQGQSRTADTTIFSRVLYQLSYLAAGTNHTVQREGVMLATARRSLEVE